ncbi:hypothetical protein [Flagellimonas crocea]|uniref:hypothetical protein n=1 Tax=Flagellimonas crocea TaxID=3067311 RepID=UPI00296FC10F|nr:hypothetical protein [Muricauda sp. DH64]
MDSLLVLVLNTLITYLREVHPGESPLKVKELPFKVIAIPGTKKLSSFDENAMSSREFLEVIPANKLDDSCILLFWGALSNKTEIIPIRMKNKTRKSCFLKGEDLEKSMAK